MNPKMVKCPRCKKMTEYSPSNTYRPFCSERCQLIDFGDWAEEKFAIPVDHSERNDHEQNITKRDDEDGDLQ